MTGPVVPSPTPEMQPDGDAIVVNERVRIPRGELDVQASRAGGAGGQKVNKTSSRIEIRWNVRTTAALDEASRQRVLEKLAARLDGEGHVRVVSSEMRSQHQNRERAERRLGELVAKALLVPRARRKTKPTRASKEARLQDKKRHAERKKNRRAGADD